MITAEEYFHKGVADYENNNLKNAIESFTNAIELDKDYAFAFFWRGYIKSKLPDNKGTIEDYSKAIEINPDFLIAYSNRGLAKDKLLDYHGAIEDYSKVIEINPNDAKTYNTRGLIKHDLLDYHGAIEDFNKAIKINPNYADAYFNRGRAKDELLEYKDVNDDYHSAIENYSKAIEINPNDAYAYYYRGRAKYKLLDYHGAIENYSKAIEINPNYADTYCNRGFIKNKLLDYKGAIEDYNKAIEINPNYLIAYSNRGFTKRNLLDYKGAIEDSNKAIEINPNYAMAYYNRGRTKKELLDYQGAIEDYNKAIEINPHDADAYGDRGHAKYKLLDYHGAIEDSSIAIEINPNASVAYLNRGAAKHSLLDYDGAIEDYSKAIEINPNYADAYFNRGNVKRNLSDYNGAIEDYSIVIIINSNDADAYYKRGRAYEALNKNANAGIDFLSCLYVSIKQKQIKYIYSLSKKLEEYPQNIQYAFEHFDIQISSFFLFQSVCNKLADFELLLKYYVSTKKLQGRELLNMKALLYYYLGGNVQSFRIYDEQLDDGKSPISAQELYYYALTAHEIGYYEAQAILKDCICQLENQTKKTDEENYYLAHLYLLNGEDEKAKEQFNLSATFKFSTIMLKDDIDDNDFQQFALNGEIDYNKDISQFSDFFYFRECCNVSNEYTDIWKAFYLSDKSREEIIPIVRKFEANEILQMIQQHFAEELEKQVTDKKDYLQNELDLILKELSAFTNELLDYLNRQLTDTKLDFGNQIGIQIEKWGITKLPNLNPFSCYSLIIQYYYCKGNLSEEQAFTAYCYLLHIFKKKNPNIKIDKLISDIGKTIASDIHIKLFFTATQFIWDTIKENFNDETENQNSESDYRKFQKNLLKTITDDREYLSSEKFNKKYFHSDWLKENAI